jgi:hypothetical protein
LKKIEIEEMSENELENDDDKPSVSTNLYPALKTDSEEQAMPTLNVSRKPNDKNVRVNFKEKVEGEGILCIFYGFNYILVLIDYHGGENTDESGKKKGILSKVRLPKLLKERFTSNGSPKTPESDSENGKWTGRFPKLLPPQLRHSTPGSLITLLFNVSFRRGRIKGSTS